MRHLSGRKPCSRCGAAARLMLEPIIHKGRPYCHGCLSKVRDEEKRAPEAPEVTE